MKLTLKNTLSMAILLLMAPIFILGSNSEFDLILFEPTSSLLDEKLWFNEKTGNFISNFKMSTAEIKSLIILHGKMVEGFSKGVANMQGLQEKLTNESIFRFSLRPLFVSLAVTDPKKTEEMIENVPLKKADRLIFLSQVGRSYSEKGRYTDAQRVLEKVVIEKPHLDSLLLLAETYLNQGSSNNAQVHLDRLQKQNFTLKEDDQKKFEDLSLRLLKQQNDL